MFLVNTAPGLLDRGDGNALMVTMAGGSLQIRAHQGSLLASEISLNFVDEDVPWARGGEKSLYWVKGLVLVLLNYKIVKFN
jgi:hypothetical protein